MYFPFIHGGMSSADVGAKEALRREKMLEDELESRQSFLLHAFSLLSGIARSWFGDAFVYAQPGTTEAPASLGAPTPTQHL